MSFLTRRKVEKSPAIYRSRCKPVCEIINFVVKNACIKFEVERLRVLSKKLYVNLDVEYLLSHIKLRVAL